MTDNSSYQTTTNVRRLGGIGDWLTIHATQRPEQEAVVFGDCRLTYGQLNERVDRAAQVLVARGIGSGDRVALLLANGNAFLEVLFACAKLGAIAVPLNYRLSTPELAFILADAGATVLVQAASFADLVAPVHATTAVRHLITVADDAETVDDEADYEALLAAQPATAPAAGPIGQDDPLMMMYTSGTTGRPKGALLSHGNITWNCIHYMLSDLALRKGDVILTVAPLFHIGGMAVNTLTALYLGVTVVLHAQFEPLAILRTIERERICSLFMLPAMWQVLSRREDFDDHDLSSMRTLFSGGAPCPVPVIEFFQQRGLAYCEGFGMTETTAGAVFLGATDAIRKNGSVGLPLTHVQMRIVDDDDRDVAPGDTGELLLRGPNMFLGYWNRPEATAEACRGGWFHTGDLARQDEDGFYYIVDRKKDMLISGGENVYPTEVEQVLHCHPDIREVAVIGVADDKWGEVPMAIVVPRAGSSLTLEAVQAFCRERLARFKTPRHLVCVDALPRTATGKLLKRSLREQFRLDA